MATQRPVCPACGDTKTIRYGQAAVDCPLHDGQALVDPPVEVYERIQAGLDKQAQAERECRGGMLAAAVVVAVLVAALITVALVVLW